MKIQFLYNQVYLFLEVKEEIIIQYKVRLKCRDRFGFAQEEQFMKIGRAKNWIKIKFETASKVLNGKCSYVGEL